MYSARVPRVELLINWKATTCIANIGAEVNFMPAHLFSQLDWQPTSTFLKTYGDLSLSTLGECFLTVEFNGKMVNAFFRAAVPKDSVPLLFFTLSKEL